MAYAGESQLISVKATSTKVIDGVFNIGIIDGKGVITEVMEARPAGPTTYVAKFVVSPKLSEGVFQGSLEVRLCRDDPAVCAQPIQGSPWLLPYKIAVQKGTNLTPLAALPTTATLNPATRNAFIPFEITAANFNRRWMKQQAGVSIAASDSGRLLGWNNGGIGAISEFDGSSLWARGGNGSQEREWYSGLTAANGKLWVVAQDYDGRLAQLVTALMAIDAANGKTLNTTRLEGSPPFTHYSVSTGSPVVDAGAVYSGTVLGTVSRASESAGVLQWSGKPSVEDLPLTGGGFPLSMANGTVVGFDGSRLWCLDAATGAPVFSVKAASAETARFQSDAPVLAPSGTAYVSTYSRDTPTSTARRLFAFDLSSRSLRWTKSGVTSRAVEREGVVYVFTDEDALLAMDVATGKELWRWVPPETPFHPMDSGRGVLLLVGKHAFASVGNSTTYAIDLNTRKSVWQYPAAGALFLTANGTLVISGGTAVAINLR